MNFRFMETYITNSLCKSVLKLKTVYFVVYNAYKKKYIYIYNSMHTDSRFYVLNFMFAAYRPNFAEVARATKNPLGKPALKCIQV
jgi:hypothetical protein